MKREKENKETFFGIKSLEEFIEKNCIKNGVFGQGLGCKDCKQAFPEVFSFCKSFEQMKKEGGEK